jgi:hypothetical protein
MKGWIFIGAMLVSMQVAAQGYEFIKYRSNDPFVFCTQGQGIPTQCWWPVYPYTGAFMVNPGCRPPNPYGKQWTTDDWGSYYQYLAVCPMAHTSGDWTGQGAPEMSPFKH